MSDSSLPLILEPETLQVHLADENILLVDVGQPETYVQRHIPGAVFLEYGWVLRSVRPVMGLLPEARQLENVFGSLGIGPQTHVVAYDDEGGGRASRLLWTLECAGHNRFSLLNGGLHAWTHEGRGTTDAIRYPQPGEFTLRMNPEPIAEKDFILAHMQDEDTVILDARSPQEFTGAKVYAARGGHIPGAVNFEWTEAMDSGRDLRLKNPDTLREDLAALGITPDKTIVTHCQTHHRSAHTYVVLKSLGFEKVKGYPGSWSEWGNDPATPIDA